MSLIINPNRVSTPGTISDVIRMIDETEPGDDGLARSRWLLVGETIKDLDIIARQLSKRYKNFERRRLHKPIQSGLITHDSIHCELFLISAFHRSHAERFRNLSVSGVYIHNTFKMPQYIIVAAGDRAGRYPANKL